MIIPQEPSARHIDPRIRKELLAAAKRLRENKLYRQSSRRWLMASGVALVILIIRTFWPASSAWAFPAVCGVVLITWLLNLLAHLKTPVDFTETTSRSSMK